MSQLDQHRSTRRHQDVECPTCHAPVGMPCITVRQAPWMLRWGWPTHPAHIARQLVSAHELARRSGSRRS